jgi:hypothetical protein
LIEIAEVERLSALTGVVPEMVVVKALGLPAMKRTVPSAFTTGVTIDRVLLSAFFELSVQVETPKVFETEQSE